MGVTCGRVNITVSKGRRSTLLIGGTLRLTERGSTRLALVRVSSNLDRLCPNVCFPTARSVLRLLGGGSSGGLCGLAGGVR